MADFEMATPEMLDALPDLPDDLPPLPAASTHMPNPMAGGGGQRPDGIPIFEVVSRQLPDGKWINVEMVSIITPGDNKAVPRHKVTDITKQKFRDHYIQWRRQMEVAPAGTPLEMWPGTQPATIAHLKSLNIFTVEQLAEVADSNLGNIPMGRTLRNKAEAYLKAMGEAGNAEVARRETETLREGMQTLEEQVRLLAEQNAALMAEKRPAPAEDERRGPGRPKKDA